MNKILMAAAAAVVLNSAPAQETKPPVRVAIIGLVHDHANDFIPKLARRTDIQLVGIVEPDHTLAGRYAARYHLDAGLFHDTFDDLLAHTKVDAVGLFTTAYDHKRMVEMCAPHGVTIMMEKPMAVNAEAAAAMLSASKQFNVPIIINYQTTWNPANKGAYDVIHQPNGIGEVRRMIACFGHSGPKEIGCSADFVNWLTDPKLNGGGALVDFGCYSANLMTWMMDGRAPTSVFATTLHIKPDVYPKVEDDATIVLTYPNAVGVIQASWNWPYSRTDLDIYGQSGYVRVTGKSPLRIRLGNEKETEQLAKPLESPATDDVSYLVAVTRREIEPSGPSSLEYNFVVTRILDAARRSAETGKRIDLTPVD